MATGTVDVRAVLAPHVRAVHAYDVTGVAPGVHIGMPSRGLTLVFALDEPLRVTGDGLPGPTDLGVCFAGLHAGPVHIHHEGRQRGLQLDLTPSGARALFGLPAGEVGGLCVDLEDVLGPGVRAVRDRLHEVDVRSAGLSAVAELVARRVRRGPTLAAMDDRLARAWAHLCQTNGQVTVRALAEDAGWSTRHFTERFTAEFGLGPKTAARVLRFERSRVAVLAGRPGAEVATSCGYADQAHMVRDWRALSGTTPTRWAVDDELAPVRAPISA